MNRAMLVAGAALLTASAAPAFARPSRSTMLPERARPPHFTLPDARGHAVSLQEFLGRNRIILLFVPKTMQAQGHAYLEAAEREKTQFTDRDLVVLWIGEPSGTPAEAPQPFYVLTDHGGRVAAEYHAAADRTTFYLIGKDGHVAVAREGYPTNRELFGVIDAMPMRRQEMREHGR